MPSESFHKVKTKHGNLDLRVSKGHFATSHSHLNYYIDITTQKTCLAEAKAVAKELASYYNTNTIVDTVLCLDGTEVIGTCLARELTNSGYLNINAQQPIYILTPEHTTGSQLIFRDNSIPAVKGKRVLILAASVSTGYTAQAAVEAIKYYEGAVAGICAVLASQDTCCGLPVRSVFDTRDLDNYFSLPSHECPLCKEGKKIDALVNAFGYSKL